MDELEEQLLRRDRRFLYRLALSLVVVLLGGLWGFLKLQEADIGGCAAHGFQNLTNPEAAPAQGEEGR
jgi:hypothetical protein